MGEIEGGIGHVRERCGPAAPNPLAQEVVAELQRGRAQEAHEHRSVAPVPGLEFAQAPQDDEPELRHEILDVLRIPVPREPQPHLRLDQRLEVRHDLGHALALALDGALDVDGGVVGEASGWPSSR